MLVTFLISVRNFRSFQNQFEVRRKPCIGPIPARGPYVWHPWIRVLSKRTAGEEKQWRRHSFNMLRDKACDRHLKIETFHKMHSQFEQ